METANLILALQGDDGNTVPKHGVTPMELLALITLHGDTSVSAFTLTGETSALTKREDRDRVMLAYGAAADSNGNLLLAKAFSGVPVSNLPNTFADVMLDEECYTEAAWAALTGTKQVAPKRARKKTGDDDEEFGAMPASGNVMG